MDLRSISRGGDDLFGSSRPTRRPWSIACRVCVSRRQTRPRRQARTPKAASAASPAAHHVVSSSLQPRPSPAGAFPWPAVGPCKPRYDAYLFTVLCNGSSVDSAGGGRPPPTSQPVGHHDKKRSWSDASERNTQKRGRRSEAHWLLASRRLRLVPMVGRKRMGMGLFGTGTRKGVASNGRRRQGLGRGEVAAIEFQKPPTDSLAPPLAREAAARISCPFLHFFL